MAMAVAAALQNRGSLLVEAGTGVGKSLAYLIPAVRYALEHGRKAIISTHTINLQERIYQYFRYNYFGAWMFPLFSGKQFRISLIRFLLIKKDRF